MKQKLYVAIQKVLNNNENGFTVTVCHKVGNC